MKQRNLVVFTASAFLFLAVFSASSLRASPNDSNTPSKADIIQKTQKLQIPFIANEGQADERVKFYANTFGGTVFVTKDGEIVYALPGGKNEALGNASANGRSPLPGLEPGKDAAAVAAVGWVKRSEPNKTLALKETIAGGKISGIKGEENAVTNVSYFKGKDPSKWKANIPTFEVVNLGEVYGGIELKLKAYGNNVEKLFCVKPGADPDRIKIRLSGVNDCGAQTDEDVGLVKRSAPNKEPNPQLSSDAQNPKLQINKSGQLVAKTALGPVKFTKPIAYQEINGKRVEVDCKYAMRDRDPSSVRYSKKTSRGNGHAHRTPPTDTDNGQRFTYGFAVASYDQTKDLIIDPLLASTYLGGSSSDLSYSIVLDTSGNVYVTGYTYSSDFPTLSGAYDTSYSDSRGRYSDVFVSKLNNGLTSLLASTFLGGSSYDDAGSLALDISGNVYVTGYTMSSDFPTTSGAYDTSFNGYYDIFVSKFNSGLTSLLASTYLGGSADDYGYSLALDTSGNVYVTGSTDSTNFPTTSGAYDTSNNYVDVFVSKLDSGLTSLPASTYLGRSGSVEGGRSLTLDTSGNVYVTGYTGSSDFPTTSGAYDTSQSGGGGDVFVSKLDGDLSASPPTATTGSATNVSLTSATLNGTVNANNKSTTVWFQYDTVSGAYTNTSSTQTVTGTSDTTVSISIVGLSPATTYYCRIAAQNDVGTAYGSETSFTTLSDTATPTGSLIINGNAIYTNSPNVTLSLSASDNLGVTGYYLSSSASTPSASDTGWTSVTSTNSYSSNVSYTLSSGDGSKTLYVWYKDSSGNISNSASDSITLDTVPPTITITSPTSSDTYTVTSSVIAIGGNASDDTSGISAVAWSNDKGGSGTASGTTSWLTSSISLMLGENTITVTATDNAGNTGSDTITVTYAIPTPVSSPTPRPTPSPTPTDEPDTRGSISGYVTDRKDNPIESAKIRLLGVNSEVFEKTVSDEDGFFEFTDLDPDTYIITAIKKGYKNTKQTVILEAGEEKDIEIVMKKGR